MYAVVETSGHQFRVREGETVRLDRLANDIGDAIELDRVLMVSGDDVRIGAPVIEGARVTGTVVKHGKGPKIVALNFKRRKGYHRRVGFRAQFTDVRIDKIEL